MPHVVAEIESAGTLTAVIAEGLGATILPESMARRVVASVSRLAVADRRAGDRGAAGALPVRPPAALGAGAGGQGHPARARRRAAGATLQAGRQEGRAADISRSYRGRDNPSWRARVAAPLLLAEAMTGQGAAMDLDEIKALIDALAASDLAEMELRRGGWTLRLVRRADGRRRRRRRGGRAAAARRADAGARLRRPRGQPACARRCPASSTCARARRARLRRGRAASVEAGDAVAVIEAMKVFNESAPSATAPSRPCSSPPATRSRPASRSCGSAEADVRLRPHRQSRRDRAPHPARLPRARPAHGRGPFGGRSRRAPRPRRRHRRLHRPGPGGAELPRRGGDPARGRGDRRGGDPSRLRLPVGERRLRRAVARGRADLHRPERRLHPHDGRQGRGQARHAARPASPACRARTRALPDDPDAVRRIAAEHRLSGHPQGGGRRRRARHAGRDRGGRPRRRAAR